MRIRNLTKKSKIERPIEDVLEITASKPMTHPRTRMRLKEKAIARANSGMVQANLPFNFEEQLGKPLLFNSKMVSESEIMDWIMDNLPIGNDTYYIDHETGSNVFTVKVEPTTERNNSEIVLNNAKFKLKVFLNMLLLFDLNMVSESEILDWFLRNFPRNNSKSKYYLEHDEGSNLFVERIARENSKLIKESIRKNRLIDPLVYVGVPLRFDLDEIDEIEIENHLAKSIRYLHDTNLTRGVFYTLDHEIGSDIFIIRRVN